MMSVVNHLVYLYLRARLPRVHRFIQHPHEAQAQVLQSLLHTARNTSFGKQHRFAEIKTADAFRQEVPLHDYETLKPWFERIQHGEQKVLWPSGIRWFSKSSGTTDKSKFIPVSQEALDQNHVHGGKDLMALYYEHFPKSRVFAGKGLMVGGSHRVSPFAQNMKSGDVSAILIQNMDEWLQPFREPKRAVAVMENWEEKIEALARSTMHEDITNVSGVPTWTLLIFKRILELSGKQTLAEVWPNFELFVHGGVGMLPYQKQFDEIIGKPVNYTNAYNASEGFFAFQDWQGEGMLLHLSAGVFFEFLPLDELGKENPRTLLLHDVELGKNYALIISTNSGLWRYNIGDTVQFVSRAPYRIIISGRTKQCINVFGEELMVENCERALAQVCAEQNCAVRDYTVAPVFLSTNSQGAHQWLIEFEKAPQDAALFAQRLDAQLQQLNSDYEAKRKGDLAMKQLLVSVASEGTFHRWLKANNKFGGQHKVPRLSNTRHTFENIIAFDI